MESHGGGGAARSGGGGSTAVDSATTEKVRTAQHEYRGRASSKRRVQVEGCACVYCRDAQGEVDALSSENQRLKKRIEREMQENDRLRQDL